MNFIEIIDKVRNNEPLIQEELNLLLNWLLSEEGKQQFHAEVERRWNEFNTDRRMEYDELLQKIHQQMSVPSQRIKIISRKYIRYAMEIAASIILAVGVFLFIDSRRDSVANHLSVHEEQVEIYNPKGLRTTVTLPDSSKVTLNADSKISYAYQFAGNTRTVRLEGEAYFEVTKDAQKPFIVEANAAKMIVHGTTFNVRSYATDKFIETTLIEGSLTVDAGKERNLLVPGRQVSINKASMESNVHAVNTQNATAWIEGKIYFYSHTFTEIAAMLERTFNVNIEVNNTILQSKKFTGKFENGESIDQILQVLRLSVPFADTYDKETNTIKIS